MGHWTILQNFKGYKGYIYDLEEDNPIINTIRMESIINMKKPKDLKKCIQAQPLLRYYTAFFSSLVLEQKLYHQCILIHNNLLA